MDGPYIFHSFTEADITPLAELLHRYRAAIPCRPQTDGHVYLSPAFESGQYVLCAEADERRLVAYAAIYPQGEMVWTHILVEIGLPKANVLQDQLFDWLIDLARKLGIIRLAFQYYPAERNFIDYIQNKGAKYTHSIYAMQHSLDLPIPIIPPPEGFEIRQLRM